MLHEQPGVGLQPAQGRTGRGERTVKRLPDTLDSRNSAKNPTGLNIRLDFFPQNYPSELGGIPVGWRHYRPHHMEAPSTPWSHQLLFKEGAFSI